MTLYSGPLETSRKKGGTMDGFIPTAVVETNKQKQIPASFRYTNYTIKISELSNRYT